jgi:hypothetical protein
MTLSKKDSSSPVQVAVQFIRAKSEAGDLVSREEIFQHLLDHHLLNGQSDELDRQCEAVLGESLQENEDLVKLQAGEREIHFFSDRSMTEAYAIILARKRSDPLELAAELVRRNSALYPRPTPVELFEQPPFDLTQKEIQDVLTQMAGQEEYRDIQRTNSSLGTGFLFSALHLEPAYAAMLAEWVDVGLANNP